MKKPATGLLLLFAISCSEQEPNYQKQNLEYLLNLEYNIRMMDTPSEYRAKFSNQLSEAFLRDHGVRVQLYHDLDAIDSKSSAKARMADPCYYSYWGLMDNLVHLEYVDEGNGTWCAAYQYESGFAMLSCHSNGSHIGYWCTP